MSMIIELPCKRCGAPLDLDAEIVDLHDGRKIDIKITCDNCDRFSVFAFVPVVDFMDDKGNHPFRDDAE
jgi:uncharacterized Zn finger protein